MFLSKCTPKSGVKRQRPSVNTFDMHQDVWRLFPNTIKTEKDFLYTVHNGIVFVLSQRKPIYLTTSCFNVETKVFNPVFSEDQKLQFDIRINLEKKEIDTQVRKSVSIIYAKKLKKKGIKFKWDRVNYEATKEWFELHSKRYGFMVLDYQVLAHDFYDFKTAKEKPRIFNSFDLHGVLKVTDPELFLKTYSEGIGKSKAYGCGLFLLAQYG